MAQPATIEGLLLCEVAHHGLAVAAHHVARIESWDATSDDAIDATAQHARDAFEIPRALTGKMLEDEGAWLVVDGLKIHADPAPFFASPAALAQAAGGALKGFVTIEQRLWPVVDLPGLCRYLQLRALREQEALDG